MTEYHPRYVFRPAPSRGSHYLADRDDEVVECLRALPSNMYRVRFIKDGHETDAFSEELKIVRFIVSPDDAHVHKHHLTGIAVHRREFENDAEFRAYRRGAADGQLMGGVLIYPTEAEAKAAVERAVARAREGRVL